MEQYKPPAGVYFLRQGNEVVYVGQTNDIYRRISEHARGRVKPGQQVKFFTKWDYIPCEDEEERIEYEYFFISILRPKYNEDMRCRIGHYHNYHHTTEALEQYNHGTYDMVNNDVVKAIKTIRDFGKHDTWYAYGA